MSDGRSAWMNNPQTIETINDWIRTHSRSEVDATIRVLFDIAKRAEAPPRPSLVSLK
jgi:hypothetical protein